MKSILVTLQESGAFTAFLDLIRRAGMEERLRTGGPYTVFAPDDDALQAVPRTELDSIRDDADQLIAVVTTISSPGHSVDLLGIRPCGRSRGRPGCRRCAGGMTVNDAPVVETNAWCTNGSPRCLHALLPPIGVAAVWSHRPASAAGVRPTLRDEPLPLQVAEILYPSGIPGDPAAPPPGNGPSSRTSARTSPICRSEPRTGSAGA